MDVIIEIIKAIILGVVEGITEWLPISSTGHMILVDEFMQLDESAAFKEMFFVVIQLGAILAVVVRYFGRLIPIKMKNSALRWDVPALVMWVKIIVASIPAAVVGLLFDDVLNEKFYNYQTVSIMLILFGIVFIIVESGHRGRWARVNSIAEITYKDALMIGIFQMIAAVFPGTSRSGATIIGGLLLGVSRVTAAEFTFFLAVPAMFGASLLKLVKFGFDYSRMEVVVLVVGLIVAYIVSMLTIRFLVGYIQKHNFKVFGWYRIVLGVVVLLYFLVAR